MNVINKWQKTGIIFKNEVLHVLNAETYPDHPNSLEKRKVWLGEKGPLRVKEKKDRKWPCRLFNVHASMYLQDSL